MKTQKSDLTVVVDGAEYAVNLGRGTVSGPDATIVKWVQDAVTRIAYDYSEALGQAQHFYANQLKKIAWVKSVTVTSDKAEPHSVSMATPADAANVIPDA
jgi:hypothetical protein